jgi:hypothetical protein
MRRAVVKFNKELNDFIESAKTERQDASNGTQSLVERTDTLLSTMKFAAGQRGDKTLLVESQVASVAQHLQLVLRSRNHVLGVYTNAANAAKQRQKALRAWRSEQLGEKQEAFDRQDVQHLLMTLDGQWWRLRTLLDGYLDVAAAQTQGYERALDSLHAYTTDCGASFAELRAAYSDAMETERTAHRSLLQTWDEAPAAAGLLVSRIVDGDALFHFAAADTSTVTPADVGLSANTSLCDGSEAEVMNAVSAAVKRAVSNGYFGETVDQLRSVLAEVSVVMERRRAIAKPAFTGETAFRDTINRAAEAREAVVQTLPKLVRITMKRLKKDNCIQDTTKKEKRKKTTLSQILSLLNTQQQNKILSLLKRFGADQ